MDRGAPPTGSPVVGWLPGGPCANVKTDFCPQANLFCGEQNVAAWRSDAGDPPGRTATLSELAEVGDDVRAEMRRPGDYRCPTGATQRNALSPGLRHQQSGEHPHWLTPAASKSRPASAASRYSPSAATSNLLMAATLSPLAPAHQHG